MGSEDAFRIRIGDYRVIYTVDDAVLIVAIESVRHRREVYRCPALQGSTVSVSCHRATELDP